MDKKILNLLAKAKKKEPLDSSEKKAIRDFLATKGQIENDSDDDISDDEISFIDSYMGSEDFSNDFPQEVQESIDPVYQAEINLARKNAEKSQAQQQQSAAEQKLVDDRANAKADVYNVSKGAVDVGNIVEASRQISQGKRLRQHAEENRPQLPAQVRGEELREATQEAGARAQRGMSNQSLGALGSRDMTAYANAMQNAGANAGGQAGVASSLASKIYRDAIARNLMTASQNEAANQQNFGQYAQLANSRANELGQIRSTMNNQYYLDRQDNNRRIGEASELERTGRVNLANNLVKMPYTAANLTNQYFKAGQQRGDVPLEGSADRPAYDQEQARTKLQRKYNTNMFMDKILNRPKESVNPDFEEQSIDSPAGVVGNPYFGGL